MTASESQLSDPDRALLTAVRRAGVDDRVPTTRRVADLLAEQWVGVGLGTEPWWGLEDRARDLEKRGLLEVLTRLDEVKTAEQAMRTTDDYGLRLTGSGAAALDGAASDAAAGDGPAAGGDGPGGA